MANQPYLAMTAAEFLSCSEMPPKVAWMACHFSPYGRGLSNIPKELPQGSMLILNDRIEPMGIDPDLIATQLRRIVGNFECSSVLLDFQRPGNELTMAVAKTVTQALPCPVAVSSAYADLLNCAVFLSPPPLQEDLQSLFTPWAGREIWLEIYDQWEIVTVTADDVKISTDFPATKPELPHYDAVFHCHYAVQTLADRAFFILHRGMDNWLNSNFPITNFIALWQDYHL